MSQATVAATPANAVEVDQYRPRFLRRALLLVAFVFVGVFSVPAVKAVRVAYYMHQAGKLASDPEFAIEPLLAAKELAPDRHDVLFSLAVCYRRTAQFEKCRDLLDRLYRDGYPREELDLQKLLVQVQLGHDNEPEVQKRLAKLMAQTDLADDLAEQLYEAMAKGLLGRYRLAEAFRILEHWEKWRVDSGQPRLAERARLWMADLHARGLQSDEAMEIYKKILDANENCLQARMQLAQHYTQGNDVESGLDHLQKALEHPDVRQNPALELDLKMAIADACTRLPSNSDRTSRSGLPTIEEIEQLAKEVLEGNVASSGTKNMARVILADILKDREGYEQEAIELLDALLQDDPNNVEAHDKFSLLLANVGEIERSKFHRDKHRVLQEQAAELFRRSRELIGDPGNIPTRFRVAQLLAMRGDMAEAASWLDTLLQFAPNHAPAHRMLAAMYQEVGKTQEAEMHLAAAEESEKLVLEEQSARQKADAERARIEAEEAKRESLLPLVAPGGESSTSDEPEPKIETSDEPENTDDAVPKESASDAEK